MFIHKYTVMKTDSGDTELQNNILKFGYGINYKYMGSISQPYDKNCKHLEDAKRKGRLT